MKILVWDLPTRLFHGLFAASFALAWLTAEAESWFVVHVFAGYLMLGLVAYRLVWGFVGGRYARFSTFCFSPRQAFAYLWQAVSGKAPRYLGHNPAGSWAIYLLLGLAVLAGLSGLFTLGGQEGQGPFAAWVPYRAGEALGEVHEAAASLMLAVVIGHIAGVVLESWLHRENLPRAMVTGRKAGTPDAAARSSHPVMAMALLIAVGAGAKEYFSGHAATLRAEEVGFRIERSIDPRETPLRITTTPYWQDRHRDISEAVWRRPQVGSKANCAACHRDMEQGDFAAIDVPGEVATRLAMR